MTQIREIDAGEFDSLRAPLAELLIDTVDRGASVGFLRPLSTAEASEWVASLAASIAAGSRLLWIAEDGGRVLGSVQFELCLRANGLNRAEVQKLMVHGTVRRGGIGRALMAVVEGRALTLGRGLLYLDTEAGCPAEDFYRSLGYLPLGGLPDYACNPDGKWGANAIYYKTLFRRNTQ